MESLLRINEQDVEFHKEKFLKKFVLCTYIDQKGEERMALGVVEHITDLGQLMIQGTTPGETWSIHYSQIRDLKKITIKKRDAKNKKVLKPSSFLYILAKA